LPFKRTLRREDLQRVFDESLWKNVEVKEHEVQGHPVVDVHLTNDMLITALVIGVRVRQSAIEKKIHGVEGVHFKEHIIAYEGVLAVSSYLFDNYLKSLDYVSIGKADEADLILKDGRVINVKTRSKPEHDLLMIYEEQWHKRKSDLYVACNEIAELKKHSQQTRLA